MSRYSRLQFSSGVASGVASVVASVVALVLISGAAPRRVDAQPRVKPAPSKPVVRADLDRLEQKIDDDRALLDNVLRLHQQYAQSLGALLSDAGLPPPPPIDPKPVPAKPDATPNVKPDPKLEPRPPARTEPAAARSSPRPAVRAEPRPAAKLGAGTIVGKVAGARDAYVYIEDITASASGSATMKQEGKQFSPRVLAVQKGTTVAFPNVDAIFHNVFSVTPDNSFDLGSYRQGESKGITLSKPGVVSVYCNMHPQMVGHILIVPNGYFVRAGQDGFYRLAGVPAGRHRVVAWAPNAKPVSSEVEVIASEVATVEFGLKQGRATTHTNKDGMAYGSYKD
jgi:plastocyanin